jgi:hypothetical protein
MLVVPATRGVPPGRSCDPVQNPRMSSVFDIYISCFNLVIDLGACGKLATIADIFLYMAIDLCIIYLCVYILIPLLSIVE